MTSTIPLNPFSKQALAKYTVPKEEPAPVMGPVAPVPAPKPSAPLSSSGGGGGGAAPVYNPAVPPPVFKIPGVTVPAPAPASSPAPVPKEDDVVFYKPGVIQQEDGGIRVTLRPGESSSSKTETKNVEDIRVRQNILHNMNIVSKYPDASTVYFEGDTKGYSKQQALDLLAGGLTYKQTTISIIPARKSEGIQPLKNISSPPLFEIGSKYEPTVINRTYTSGNKTVTEEIRQQDPVSEWLNKNIPSIKIYGREITSGEIVSNVALAGLMAYGTKAPTSRASYSKQIKPFFKKEIIAHMNEKGYVDYFSGRKYVEVFNKKLYYESERVSPKMSNIYKPAWEYEPPGLASSISKPTPTQTEIPYIKWNNKIYTGNSVKWQPKTGIPEPGVYTPGQMILRPLTKIKNVPKISYGKLIPYESKLPFYAQTEGMYFNERYLSKGFEWQPKTGIKEPSVKPIKWYDIDPKPLPENILTKPRLKLKPVPPTVTKLDVSQDGVLGIKKYGRNFIDTGVIKNYGVGIPEPGVYTGKQLWTTVYPKPKVYRSYETYYRFLDVTALYNKYFGYSVKPKQTKIFTAKDILKTDQQVKTKDFGVGNTQQRGQQTIQIEKPLTAQESISVTDTIQEQIKMTRQENKGISKQISSQQSDFSKSKKDLLDESHMFKGLSVMMNKKASQSQSMIQSYEQGQQQKQETISISLTIPKQISIFNTGQIITPIKTQTDITIPRTTKIKIPIEIQTPFRIKIPRTFIEEPPNKPTEPIKTKYPGLPDDTFESKPSVKPSGYNVYVKDRSYVHGRKKYSDRWVKVNKIPLSEDAALSLGGTAVDQSAAASFKIKETESKAGKLRIAVDPWASISGKFYRKGNIYIEGTGTRIDSSGEIKGISALGWIAGRGRGYKPLSFKQPRQQMMMQEFKYKPMNINMLMKGWKL